MIFRFTRIPISVISLPVPYPSGGALRIVTKRWVRDAMDVGWRQVATPARHRLTDGEVVWSWRRDRGVYPARLCGFGNGDNQRRSPGRAHISRKLSRGESRRGRLHLWCFARVLRHAGCPCASARGIYGCISAPGFPCALLKKGDNATSKTRTHQRRGARGSALYHRTTVESNVQCDQFGQAARNRASANGRTVRFGACLAI